MSNPFNIAKEGSVSSRFVSSTELTEAQKKREEELREAYTRIGQSPPPSSSNPTRGDGKEEEYDPRSLFEKLQAQKNSKQERFEETWKLSNQFRGIDEGESEFLAEVARGRREEERKKREEEAKELEAFRIAAQARETSPTDPVSLLPKALSNSPPPALPASAVTSSTKAASPTVATTKAKRKRDAGGLLGIKRKSGSKKTKTGAEGEKEKDKDKPK